MIEAVEILGLDVGLKRTGIARASNVARLSEPLKSVPTKEAMAEVAVYIKEHKVGAVAIGLPRNLKGEDTDQTTWVRQWVDKAKQKIDIPLYWQDEALTTELVTSNRQQVTGKVDEHALAAAIILQDFLDSPETGRIVA